MKGYWLGLGIWGGGLVLVWWLSKGNWLVVSAVATWFLALGVAYAFLQVQQARKSTNAQLAMDLFRELRSDKTLEILRFIYRLRPQEDLQNLPTINRDNIDSVLNKLTTLGILVNEKIIDRSLAIEGFSGPTVLRCWYQLFNYIKHYQEKRGDYYENYEGFVRLCLEHFKNEHIKVKFENQHVNIENLITVLDQDKELCPRSLAKIKKDRKKRATAEEIEKQDKEKDKKKNTKSMKKEV